MQTIRLGHFLVALAVVVILAIPLGVILRDAAPAITFLSTLALASAFAISFLEVERRL